ncbi:DUF4153 domain-containing protein [Marinibaculum pumilum]|uniref:DUF4153 domain-containing protein n=1 Tax=Marinibaculum pumilum TaxID=1766165 RepID=A0ABV7L7X2_9PROT
MTLSPPSLRARLPGLAGDLLRRFPECVAMALFATLLALAAIHEAIPETWEPAALAAGIWCAATGPFLAGLRLLAEGRGWGSARHAAAGLAGAVLLALWAWNDLGLDFSAWLAAFRFLLPAAALLWALVLAPGLAPGSVAGPAAEPVDSAAARFWHGTRRALGAFAAAAVIVLVLAAGLNGALLGFVSLLDLPVSELVFADLWVVAGLLLLPCGWLALLSPPGAVGTTAMPPVLAFAIDLVLVPLALIYLAILYVYLALAVVSWELPEGLTAGLVAAYAAAGTAVWLVAAAPGHDGGRHVRLFRRLFFPALLPPLALLAAALQIRVADYGVTEPRYLIGLLALWLLGAALAQFIPIPAAWRRSADARPGRGRLAAVPAFLCLLLLLASFGPWSASAVSQASQMSRLQAALTDAGLLRDGAPAAPAPPPGFGARQALSGMLDYLASTGRLAKVNRWLPAESRLPPDADRESAARALGFAYVQPHMTAEQPRHVSMWGTVLRPLPVAGFDTMLPFDLAAPGHELLLLDGRRHRLFATAEPPGLELADSDGRSVSFPLSALMAELERSARSGDSPYIAEGADRGLSARLVLRHLSGTIGPEGPALRQVEGFVMIAPAPVPAD